MAKPAKCISVDKARQLQNNWVTTRAVDIQNARGSEDTRMDIWSLEELQEFLDYVKEKSADQGIAKPGIRIYFAAYDNPDNDNATVFFTATDGTGPTAPNNYNIEPMNLGGGGWPPHNY